MVGRKKPQQFVDGHGDVREITGWPKVTVGSHSTRTEYEDGRVELVTDWEALQRDVREAIASVENKTQATPKRTRKK